MPSSDAAHRLYALFPAGRQAATFLFTAYQSVQVAWWRSFVLFLTSPRQLAQIVSYGLLAHIHRFGKLGRFVPVGHFFSVSPLTKMIRIMFHLHVLRPIVVLPLLAVFTCKEKQKRYAGLFAKTAAGNRDLSRRRSKFVQHIFSKSAAYLFGECSISLKRMQHIFFAKVSHFFSSAQYTISKPLTKHLYFVSLRGSDLMHGWAL